MGRAAPAEFVKEVVDLARAHHSALAVDVIRAYHFGAKYNVELEIVLPGCGRLNGLNVLRGSTSE